MYVKMNSKGELLPAKGEDEGARLITDIEEEALNLTKTVVNNIKDKYFPGWNTRGAANPLRGELQGGSGGPTPAPVTVRNTVGATRAIGKSTLLTHAQAAAMWAGEPDWLAAASTPKTVGVSPDAK